MNTQNILNRLINLIELNQILEAEKIIKENEDLFYKLPEKYTIRGMIEYARKNFERAKVYFLRGLQLYENNFLLNYKLGSVAEQVSDISVAKEYYKRALLLTNNEEQKYKLIDRLKKLNSYEVIKPKYNEKIYVFLKSETLDSIYYTLNLLLSYYGFKLEFLPKCQSLSFDFVKQIVDNSPFVVSDFVDDSIIKLSDYLYTRQKKVLIKVDTDNIKNLVDKLKNLNQKSLSLLVKKSHIDAIEIFNTSYDLFVVPTLIFPEEFTITKRKDEKKIAIFYDNDSLSSILNVVEIVDTLSKIDKEFKYYLAGFPRNSIASITLGTKLREQIESNKIYIENVLFSKLNDWLDNKSLVISTKNLQNGFEYIYVSMAKGIKPLIMVYDEPNQMYSSFFKNLMFTTNTEMLKIMHFYVSPYKCREFIQEQLSEDEKYFSEISMKLKFLLS